MILDHKLARDLNLLKRFLEEGLRIHGEKQRVDRVPFRFRHGAFAHGQQVAFGAAGIAAEQDQNLWPPIRFKRQNDLARDHARNLDERVKQGLDVCVGFAVARGAAQRPGFAERRKERLAQRRVVGGAGIPRAPGLIEKALRMQQAAPSTNAASIGTIRMSL